VAPRNSDRGPVAAAVAKDLAEIRKHDADLADGALAASALALACEIDGSDNSATSKSMCARELRDTMDRLWQLMPEEENADGINDLEKQRERRRAKRAAAASS
jgi:hypothetical protein